MKTIICALAMGSVLLLPVGRAGDSAPGKTEAPAACCAQAGSGGCSEKAAVSCCKDSKAAKKAAKQAANKKSKKAEKKASTN